jgi:hypothetical protein
MLYTKITYTVEFELAFTIMSSSGSESVYSRRCLLRYLILPVCLLSLAQFAMYIYTGGADTVIPQMSCSHDGSVECIECIDVGECYRDESTCCIRMRNLGVFPVRYRAQKYWNNGSSLSIPGTSSVQLFTESDQINPDCLHPDAWYVICMDVLSLGGWRNAISCDVVSDAVDGYPVTCKVQGILFYDFVFILSVVADTFCIVASIVAFRNALKQFPIAIIATIGTVSMILSVVDLGVQWDQFPRSVFFLMGISMARIVSLLFTLCIWWVKTEEASEEKVPFIGSANVSINTPNKQEAQ